MKDTNNKPITEEEFTKGESVRVEMPVEKTVEELFEEYADLWRERQYCEKIGEVCISCIRDSERMSQILQEVKSQVRREQLEEMIDFLAEKDWHGTGVAMVQDYAEFKGITLKN